MSEHRSRVESRTGKLGAILKSLRVELVQPRALAGQQVVMKRRSRQRMAKPVPAARWVDHQQLMLDRLAQGLV